MLQEHNRKADFLSFYADFKFLKGFKSNLHKYHDCIHNAANFYGIDEKLIKSIIQVESGYNPMVVSRSNAVGLMQLKSSTAGKDVYRMRGWNGAPSVQDLKNAAINIDLGVAYLAILQKQLVGINNPQIKQYALITSYVNGLSTLLHMFSSDNNFAIDKINTFTPEKFYEYVQNYHPSLQARKYLWKVNIAYLTIN